MSQSRQHMPSSHNTFHVSCFHGCFKSFLETLEHQLVKESLQQVPLLENFIMDGMECFDPMTGGSPGVMLMDVTMEMSRQETAVGEVVGSGCKLKVSPLM